MRAIRVLSTITAAGAWLVLVLGKIVHVTGASTSIPDWPLAFGRFVPPMSRLVFWEWSHRLAVLLVMGTMVALTVCAARVRGRIWQYCVASLALLLVPAVIGGLSIVAGPLHWVYGVIDFACALLFLASMVGLAVWAHLTKRRVESAQGAGTQKVGPGLPA
jgi:heme a synthase